MKFFNFMPFNTIDAELGWNGKFLVEIFHFTGIYSAYACYFYPLQEKPGVKQGGHTFTRTNSLDKSE